jgi:hypothetical protein
MAASPASRHRSALVWRGTGKVRRPTAAYFGLGAGRLRERFRIPAQVALPGGGAVPR